MLQDQLLPVSRAAAGAGAGAGPGAGAGILLLDDDGRAGRYGAGVEGASTCEEAERCLAGS